MSASSNVSVRLSGAKRLIVSSFTVILSAKSADESFCPRVDLVLSDEAKCVMNIMIRNWVATMSLK